MGLLAQPPCRDNWWRSPLATAATLKSNICQSHQIIEICKTVRQWFYKTAALLRFLISATNILCKTIKMVTLQRFLISANFLYGLFNIESLSRPNFNSKCNLYIDIDRKEILWGCCVSNLNFYADADVLDSISYLFFLIYFKAYYILFTYF